MLSLSCDSGVRILSCRGFKGQRDKSPASAPAPNWTAASASCEDKLWHLFAEIVADRSKRAEPSSPSLCWSHQTQSMQACVNLIDWVVRHCTELQHQHLAARPFHFTTTRFPSLFLSTHHCCDDQCSHELVENPQTFLFKIAIILILKDLRRNVPCVSLKLLQYSLIKWEPLRYVLMKYLAWI